MRRTLTLTLLFAVAALGLTVGSPAQGAEPAKKFTGTIAAPAADIGSVAFGGSLSQAVQSKVNCPQAGQLDGVFYKFFDFKKGYTKFKAYGPKPVINQPVPSGVLTGAAMEYDIDVYLFDKKCVAIDTPGGGDLGGYEQTTANPRNPAFYAVIVYYSGPYPNLPVTLEAS